MSDMDNKNNSAKQTNKKNTMAVDKSKKSAGKKKKKSKKCKNDQSPDQREVEGIRALEQTEPESDCSVSRQTGVGVVSTDSPIGGEKASPSPTLFVKSSVPTDAEAPITATSTQDSTGDNEITSKTKPSKPKSARKSSPETALLGNLKHTQSASVLSTSETILRKNTVSFSNLDEIQTISTNLSTMSVKTKNASQKGKNKTGSKSSSIGASKRDRERTRTEPQKSAINKAAEEAARIRSEESLRWEFRLEDEEQELERIRVYKINRRKRYLAAAQEKGLGWVVNYGNNGSPLADESLIDLHEREPVHASVTDFSPVRSLMASQRNTPMNIGGELAC